MDALCENIAPALSMGVIIGNIAMGGTVMVIGDASIGGIDISFKEGCVDTSIGRIGGDVVPSSIILSTPPRPILLKGRIHDGHFTITYNGGTGAAGRGSNHSGRGTPGGGMGDDKVPSSIVLSTSPSSYFT